MGLLEIILFGYIFNIILILFTITYTIVIGGVEGMSMDAVKFVELTKKMDNYNTVIHFYRSNLPKKKIIKKESFSILFPFAVFIPFVKFINRAVSKGVLINALNTLQEEAERLEKIYNEYKKLDK